MAAGFMDAFRQGRAEARAARGAPSLSADEWNAGPDFDAGERNDDAGQPAADAAGLEAALRQREAEITDSKRILAEMTDYAEQLQARVIELIAGAESLAKTLRLPGVKTFLLQRFHPDKYPDADDKQRELLTEAMKTITAAYAIAGQLQTSE